MDIKQAKGLSHKVTKRLVEVGDYTEMDKLTLKASGVGGYLWAKLGVQPVEGPAGWPTLLSNISLYLESSAACAPRDQAGRETYQRAYELIKTISKMPDRDLRMVAELKKPEFPDITDQFGNTITFGKAILTIGGILYDGELPLKGPRREVFNQIIADIDRKQELAR